ncbi:MAG: hypothetical protein IPJ61_18235 [Tessaracoccus sp.]|uniref:hypothetical protein n=1 Tax=Tessaracoccus sp. TaxID=1971211 RepID=UPI001EB3CF6A|nr:hypothetical protein [Tessaracoccus sp.]MBK7822923.1 hypothetical protein [Tessaracoccus sp.]
MLVNVFAATADNTFQTEQRRGVDRLDVGAGDQCGLEVRGRVAASRALSAA